MILSACSPSILASSAPIALGSRPTIIANLPSHEDAPDIAARMAAAGVNTVRCHHLDTANWPRGIWNASDGKDISGEALDRLDYFINQLAKHGILINMNLHVGRKHSRYLGLPDPGTN